ncbi:MAG TPA: hypothetical protein VF168_00375 [Trueperaceae bacterium]
MSRPSHVMRTVTLLALLTPFGFAQTHPRAIELFESSAEILFAGEEIELPAAMSMNISTRQFTEGSPAMLQSVAFDWTRQAMRVRSCFDSELVFDSVFEGGTVTSWDSYSGEVTQTPMADGQLQELLDGFLNDPGALFEGVESSMMSYDGHVDYGVLSGEQVTVDYDGFQLLDSVPAIDEVGMIFATDGVWLGQVIHTEQGTLLAVQDGIISTDIGPSLRGMTVYQPDENGVMQESFRMRIWNVRGHDSLGEEWFSLDHLRRAQSNADRRDELSRRLDELAERIAEGDPADPELATLTDELEAIHEQFMASLEPAPIPCPEPF